LTVRQSSPEFERAWKTPVSVISVTTSKGRELELVDVRNCGHDRGFPVAITVPKLDVIGCGGFRRRGPTGGCAYGIPLKESIPAKLDPTTVAYWRSTVGANCCFAEVGAAIARGKTQRTSRENILRKERAWQWRENKNALNTQGEIERCTVPTHGVARFI
jgi:hypothetical protein